MTAGIQGVLGCWGAQSHHRYTSGDAAVLQMPVDGSAAHVAYGRGKVIVKTTCIMNQSGTIITACHSDRAGLWNLPYREGFNTNTLLYVYKKKKIYCVARLSTAPVTGAHSVKCAERELTHIRRTTGPQCALNLTFLGI